MGGGGGGGGGGGSGQRGNLAAYAPVYTALNINLFRKDATWQAHNFS